MVVRRDGPTYMKTQQYRTPILELARLPKPVRRPKATKAEAEAMDKEVIRIVGEIRSNWLRLGRLVQRFMETQAFEALGFPNVHAWMTSRLGESLSNAFSALRSVRALEGVPEEKLQRIGERNAHELTYLPEKERKSEEWLDKAATLPTKAFKQEVRTAIEKKTGLPSENFKTFSIALPEKVYESVCEAEKKLAWSLGIDIETKPGSRILVWEALAQWILLTDEETIRAHTEGM
jgi:hypothetical protein